MNLYKKINLIGFIVIICFILKTAYSFLLFPQFTLMQVVVCVSWPIPYKDPLRKLFFNVGFQFNYGEPFLLSSFYNPPFWQNAFRNRALLNSLATTNHTDLDTEGSDDDNFNEFTTESLNETEYMDNSINEPTRKTAKTKRKRNYDSNLNEFEKEATSLGSDVTAGQLYESIEDNLMRAGYDRNCLLKAICEIARHPLHQDDDEHLLAEVVHFFLTPTEHRGFAANENYKRKKYETAQRIGTDGGDCNIIYAECENSFLNEITKIVIENEIIK